MNWNEPVVRALLKQLLTEGRCTYQMKTRHWLNELENIGVVFTEGKRTFILRQSKRKLVEDILDKNTGDDSNRDNISRLKLSRYWRKPASLHRKTASALLGDHAKSGAGKPLYDGQQLFDDELLRMRTLAPMVLKFEGGKTISLDEETKFADEYVLGERGWKKLKSVSGLPKYVVTVENRCFFDLPLDKDVLYIEIPGNNMTLACYVLSLLKPPQILHFPDLDQGGVTIGERISDRLREACEVHLFVPFYATEYINAFSLPLSDDKTAWKKNSKLKLPDAIKELRALNRWMEQECLILDRRLLKDILGNSYDSQTS